LRAWKFIRQNCRFKACKIDNNESIPIKIISNIKKVFKFAKCGIFLQFTGCKDPKPIFNQPHVQLMRPKYPIRLLLPLVMLSNLLWAQEDPADKHMLGARVFLVDYGIQPSGKDLNITNALEFSWIRKIGRGLNFALPVKAGVASLPGEMNNRTFGSLDGLIQLQYPGNMLRPYLFAGAGVMLAGQDKANPQFPMGGGLNVRVGPNSFFNIQGEYRSAGLARRNHIQGGAGIIFRLGRATDSDGDGIPDEVDPCPNEPGPAATKGCPDRDGDGIPDSLDRCPDLAGSSTAVGCPDKDGDGIADAEDQCPEQAGTIMGCPDTDGDGFPDKDDPCPTQADPLTGCPDTDGDGVLDAYDNCPEAPGPESNNGCPLSDLDGDGIPDEDDRCPDDAGLESLQGCPDTDGDGVADMDDRCPEKPGPYAGCPDTDGDGIMDADDRCPEQAGEASNKGCPEIREEVKQVLITAMKTVQFETDSTSLRSESKPILDQVVKVLQENPMYHLRIKGHTDNIGEEQKNQLLSENRAKSCYEYLINQGISPDRLSYAGFGKSMPIADNKKTSGRSKNRRVEFELYLP
jgi:OOP family OmpA-OmpF porin